LAEEKKERLAIGSLSSSSLPSSIPRDYSIAIGSEIVRLDLSHR